MIKAKMKGSWVSRYVLNMYIWVLAHFPFSLYLLTACQAVMEVSHLKSTSFSMEWCAGAWNG